MKLSDFNYHLPEELIAQHPSKKRGASRLLHVEKNGQLHDRMIADITEVLQPNDLMVLNNTKVVPARLFGHKESGGKVEILLERILNEKQFLAQIRSSRSPKTGQKITVVGDDFVFLTMVERQEQFFVLEISLQVDLFEWFEMIGQVPLPPYIERRIDQDAEVNERDRERYQTVYAEHKGAVAAPTAGLHYDDALLNAIKQKGVTIETVTLHVGAGTYQPVKVNNIEDHRMHSEWIDVGQSVCDAIHKTKRNNGRVVAVGTTVVRSLETAAQNVSQNQSDIIMPFQGDTDIFISPGYEFKVVDVLQTNFHLPQSTLLMMVSAFSGYDLIMKSYQHAIKNKYRFFSYGDAMLLELAG